MTTAVISKSLEEKLDKVLHFADIFEKCVESVTTNPDGQLYLKLKDNLIIETEGSQLFYTRDGIIVLQSNTLHFNPKIEKMKVDFENGNINNIHLEIKEQIRLHHLRDKELMSCNHHKKKKDSCCSPSNKNEGGNKNSCC